MMPVKKISRIILLLSIALVSSLCMFGQIKAGSVDPKAVKMDLAEFDNLEEFHEGLAIVKKGQSYCVIDKTGKIIVPFNKYKHFERVVNGYFIAYTENRRSALLDKTGKEVLPSNLSASSCADEYGFVEVQEAYGDYYFYNIKSQKKYPKISTTLAYQYEEFYRAYGNLRYRKFVDDIACVQDMNSRKFGYVDRFGKFVIKPQFEFAESFSDGLALVSQKNEFGEEKYGFIDRKGTLVIPCQYTNRPGNFYKNRARVIPKDFNEFLLGYINKKGELQVKLKQVAERDAEDFKEDFILVHNNNSNTRLFVDTSGTARPFPKILNNNGKEISYGVNSQIVDGQLMITSGFCYGIINLQGEVIIPPIFKELSYIDIQSGLAKARLAVENNNYINGYVNKDGVFVIIKSEPKF